MHISTYTFSIINEGSAGYPVFQISVAGYWLFRISGPDPVQENAQTDIRNVIGYPESDRISGGGDG